MTKRDVATWFCRVWALFGMMSAGAGLIRALITWRIFGAAGLVQLGLPFGLYLFVWFLSPSIGTELAAEREQGEPMTSRAELGALLLRCAGFSLFLSGSLSFGPTALNWAYQHFFSNRSTLMNPIATNIALANLVSGFLESTIGFLLAFTPRLRALLRS